jgi:hypothetical protein
MKNMPLVGVVTAVSLILLSTVTLFISDSKSGTIFIPAGFGGLLGFFSALSFKASRLKMCMHIAATVGLLGMVGPVAMLTKKAVKGELVRNLATYSQAIMGIICIAFVGLCVKSFIDVRKAKRSA